METYQSGWRTHGVFDEVVCEVWVNHWQWCSLPWHQEYPCYCCVPMVDMSQLKQPMSPLRGHLAAISPYSNIFKQPPPPSSGHTHGAVYLFRHGNIEVSYHDYAHFIAPFLHKLHSLQRTGRPFVAGRLSFLSSFRSWITEAHVGMVSDEGFRQSSDLGRAFRARYKQWLIPTPNRPKPTAYIWSDSATRCRLSAMAFANGIAGRFKLAQYWFSCLYLF